MPGVIRPKRVKMGGHVLVREPMLLSLTSTAAWSPAASIRHPTVITRAGEYLMVSSMLWTMVMRPSCAV